METNQLQQMVNQLNNQVNSMYQQISGCTESMNQCYQQAQEYQDMASQAMAMAQNSDDGGYDYSAYNQADYYRSMAQDAISQAQNLQNQIVNLKQNMRGLKPQYENCYNECVQSFNDLKSYADKLGTVNGKYGSDKIKTALEMTKSRAQTVKQISETCRNYISYIDQV